MTYSYAQLVLIATTMFLGAAVTYLRIVIAANDYDENSGRAWVRWFCKLNPTVVTLVSTGLPIAALLLPALTD